MLDERQWSTSQNRLFSDPALPWRAPTLSVDRLPTQDFICNDLCNGRVMSLRAKEVFDAVRGEGAPLAWHPVHIASTDGVGRAEWWYLTVVDFVDVIDRRLSVWSSGSVIRPAFNRAKVGNRNILEITPHSYRFYVTEPLKEAIEAAGLIGCELEEVDDPDIVRRSSLAEATRNWFGALWSLVRHK